MVRVELRKLAWKLSLLQFDCSWPQNSTFLFPPPGTRFSLQMIINTSFHSLFIRSFVCLSWVELLACLPEYHVIWSLWLFSISISIYLSFSLTLWETLSMCVCGWQCLQTHTMCLCVCAGALSPYMDLTCGSLSYRTKSSDVHTQHAACNSNNNNNRQKCRSRTSSVPSARKNDVPWKK